MGVIIVAMSIFNIQSAGLSLFNHEFSIFGEEVGVLNYQLKLTTLVSLISKL